MNTKIQYPEIEFVETDVETIENSMIALFELMYEQETGKKKRVYPASPERLFISWATAIIIQQRILINETAKKNVPRYAEGKYLDSLAELFKDTTRLPASPAIAVFRCYISEAQPQSVIVKAGTRISFDSNIMFATMEDQGRGNIRGRKRQVPDGWESRKRLGNRAGERDCGHL